MERVSAVVSFVMSEGRLFSLKASDWSLLLAGVAVCGLATLLFVAARV